MTPEERAQKALSDPMGSIVPEKYHPILIERITAAVEAERQRAFEITEQYIKEIVARRAEMVAPSDPEEDGYYYDAICHHIHTLGQRIRSHD